MVSEYIELCLSSIHQGTGRFRVLRVSGQAWDLPFERLNVPVQKLGNVIKFYDTISHSKPYDLSVRVKTNHVKLPAVVNGFASGGVIQLLFEETQDRNGFNIHILDESSWAEVCHYCEGSKKELVRDASCSYSFLHDRFIHGSSFINFNPPQFYQIVEVNGRKQVIPFRTRSIGSMPFANQEHDAPLLQQYLL